MPRLKINNKENKIARQLKYINAQKAKAHKRHVSAILSKNILNFTSPLSQSPSNPPYSSQAWPRAKAHAAAQGASQTPPALS